MMPGAPDPVAILLLSLCGGFCSADARALGGRGFHQPLVAGVLAGLILGDPDAGLLFGIWLQLVWVLPLPVGGVILPDGSVAAIAAVTARAMIGEDLPDGIAYPFCLGLGILLSALSRPAERAARTLIGRAEERVAAGRPVPASVLALGIAGPFARGAVSVLVAAAAAWAAAGGLTRLHETTAIALHDPIISGAVPSLLLGAAVVAAAQLLARTRQESGRHLFRFVLSAAVVGAALRLGWGRLHP